MKTLSRRVLLGGALAGAALLLGPSWAGAAPEAAPASEATAAPAPGTPGFPKYVMDTIDDMHRGASSHGIIEMKVKTEHWSRTMEMESWSRGEDYSLIRILAPKKERGSATLKANDDLFSYLNKTGRTIKIAGAMMGSSWMGSHLNNNDLVRSSRVADDYDLTLTGKGTLEGVPHYVLLATAKADAAVVWGKIEVAVRQEDLLPTRQIFFDEDGRAIRLIEFLDYRMVGDRKIAGQMLIRPLDGTDEFTQMTFKKMEYDVDIPTSVFTLQHLKSL